MRKFSIQGIRPGYQVYRYTVSKHNEATKLIELLRRIGYRVTVQTILVRKAGL